MTVPPRPSKPSELRPPDVEIGATARADSIRFRKEPEVSVDFRGGSIVETHSGSERENLPDEVEAGETYRDIRIGWRAAAWVEDAAANDPHESADDPPKDQSGGGRGAHP